MRRIIALILIFVIVFCTATVEICASEVPTAKITASLVGETIPQAGEKFSVAIRASEISSGLFACGEVRFSWPTEVASLVDYYEEEPVVVNNDYCLGNIYNEYAGRTGKFTYVSKFYSNDGRGAVAIYITLSARDQSAEEVSDLVMFEMSFMLNEGYTYDDFYLNLTSSTLFLTADKKVSSEYKNGQVGLESLGNIENIADENNTVQLQYLLRSLNQTGENTASSFNTNINLLYNDQYHEAVLIKNNELMVDVSVENSGTNNKELVCYIAEYDNYGCLLEMNSNSTITVNAGESLTTAVSKTLDNENTEFAKIFLWEKGTFAPLSEELKITLEAKDYYSDTFQHAQAVEINKQICGVLNVENDVDIIKLSVDVTGNYVIKTDENVELILYDSGQNILTAAKSDSDYVVYSLTGDNIYYIKITGNEGNSYHIKSMIPETVEKNIGRTGDLGDLYDGDLYEFVPENTGEHIITAVGTDGVKAVLYNSDFEKISSSDIGDDFVSFRITCDMEENKTYYVVVEPKSEQTEKTSYSLYIEEPFEIVAIY